MSMKMDMALLMKLALPSMDQVTLVVAPSGLRSKPVSASEANGSMNSSFCRTRLGEVDSTMVIFPLPTSLFPSQAYVAPTPLDGAESVARIPGSRLCQGDHSG